MKLQTQARAYIRGIPSLPVDRQREMAADYGYDYIYEWAEAGRKIDVRDRWINSLRNGDIALVGDLRCLIKPKPPRESGPQIDLADTLIAIIEQGAVIVEMRTGIRSDDRKEWQKRRKEALAQAAQGERDQRSQQRAMTKARAKRGVSIRWRSPAMAKQREAAARIWRDPIYKTWREAQAALPEELHTVSLRTLYTIFDVRHPGDLRAGGRGKRKPR